MNVSTKINSFEDLIVWQKAVDLSVEVYKLSANFPKEEMFGLASQIRRASNSVSLNISEGSVKTTKTFISQLIIARGSATEVLSCAILANKLGFLSADALSKIRELISELTKILNSLISSLKRKIKTISEPVS
jgi:four helix bundle protein